MRRATRNGHHKWAVHWRRTGGPWETERIVPTSAAPTSTSTPDHPEKATRLSNRAHRRPRFRPTPPPLEAGALLLSRTQGCTCRPDINVRHLRPQIWNVTVAHDPGCPLLRARNASQN